MAHMRFVTPKERWLSREDFSEEGDMSEGLWWWPAGGAMCANPFPVRLCILASKASDY